MATSSFAGYTAPSVNGQALARQLSPTVLVNVVQSLFHTPGRGVSQNVVVDTNAIEVRVIREKPLTQKARTIGETTDGNYFSAQTAEQPTSDEYGLRVNLVYDTPIDIPTNMQDMIPIDLANATMRNYVQAVAKNINASTIATQIGINLNTLAVQEIASTGTGSSVQYTSASDDILEKFQDAQVYLDNGDSTNGVDTFPMSSRIALWRSTAKRAFYKDATGVFSVNNWKAQDMLKIGAVDPESFPNTEMNGFFGEIDQCYNYFVASAVWTLAEDYLKQDGSPVAGGFLDVVEGYICASMGTLRGIAINSQMKIVDSQAGQGIRLQPKQRWGVELIYPLSVVALHSGTKAVYARKATVGGAGAVALPLSVVAPASNT
jgi:hypothetical protein